ncbi:hypothetical protein [Pseudonocardia broussonetiae]|uniref:Uncharacterized protein n=1 Tax=Pseudonocardia broussonetiae TaxID=2736640 RepID=A0A6M6JSB4_9PSEU|nr:hypothetical protein [Pseudonocardia broussonetiae]QJY49996.1 hypothetical protein HOP40_33000 [Pseudonocardia broussonetiae]
MPTTSALKKIMFRTGRAAAIAAVTVGLTAGLATAPASAAPTPSGANLKITYAYGSGGYYNVIISGRFAMSQHDAVGYMNNLATGSRAAAGQGPGGVFYHVTGDDSGSYDSDVWRTDFFAGAHNDAGGYLFAGSDGIYFYRAFQVHASVLNEDNGYWDKTDEIYADATFVDGDNGSRRAYSNVVTGLF